MTNHFKRFFLIYLLLLLLGGGLLRSVQISHGLPLIYHVDEVKRLMLLERQIKSHDFQVRGGDPVGYVQVAYFQRAVRDWLRGWVGLKPLSTDMGSLFLEVRFTVWALGLAGLLFLVLAGKSAYGPALGLLAGLLYMLDESALVHSHYAMADLAQAGLVTGALYFCLRILDRNRLADSLAAGLMMGTAAACKYFGGYMVVVFLAAHLLAQRKRWLGLPLGLAATAVGFAALTPFLILDFPAFWDGLLAMLAIQAGHNPVEGADFLGNTLQGLADIWSYWWRYDLMAALLVPLSVPLLIWRHRRADILLLLSLLGAIAILAVMRGVTVRDWDLAIVAPLIALALARGFQTAWRLLGSHPTPPEKRWWQPGRWWRRPLCAGLLAGLLLFQAWNTAELATIFTLPDTRQQVQAWAAGRLPPARPEASGFIIDSFMWRAGKGLRRDIPPLPTDRGYEFIVGPIIKYRPGPPSDWNRLLQERRPGYALLWSLGGLASDDFALDWLAAYGPVLKKFQLASFSWFNPDIHLAALADRRLTAPLIPPSFRPAGMERVSQARTPLGWRERRELVLQHSPALPIDMSLVSDRPVERMGLLISGHGSFTLWQAWRRWDAEVEPGKDHLMVFSPRRGWPWLQDGRFYNLRLRGEHGPVLARLIIREPELAMALEEQGRLQEALEMWGLAVENGREMLPREKLACAAALKRAGHQAAADKMLASLDREYPDLRPALAEVRQKAGDDPDGAVAALARGLKVTPDMLTWRREIITLPLRHQGRQDWWARPMVLAEPRISSQRVILPGWVAGTYVRARLWVMTRGEEAKRAGRAIIAIHDGTGKVLADVFFPVRSQEGFVPIDLRFTVPREPVRLRLDLVGRPNQEVRALALVLENDLAAWVAQTWPEP